jgi:integrase
VTGSRASFGEARLWGADARSRRCASGTRSASAIGATARARHLSVHQTEGHPWWPVLLVEPASTRVDPPRRKIVAAPVAAHRPGFRASTGVSARKACVYGTEGQRFEAPDDAPVFPGRTGVPADVGSLRRRVLVPAAERAGLSGVGFHALRHTCASLLIESGLSVLRLQRWMGHHSPAFTLETHGHLIDGDLGPALELRQELRTAHG